MVFFLVSIFLIRAERGNTDGIACMAPYLIRMHVILLLVHAVEQANNVQVLLNHSFRKHSVSVNTMKNNSTFQSFHRKS